MTRLQKFFALPVRRQLLVLRCWCLLNMTAVALRFLSLPQVLRLLGTNSAQKASRRKAAAKEEVLWSVRAAAALSWKPTCAVQGLVAERMLRMHGWLAQFKVGVARDQNDFRAHAWVEDENGILVGAAEHDYHALPDLDLDKSTARM